MALLGIDTVRDAVVVAREDDEENRGNARILAAAVELYEGWRDYLSAQKTINESGLMDNYEDARRARERQVLVRARMLNILNEIEGVPWRVPE